MTWTHTDECNLENSGRLGRGESPNCICGADRLRRDAELREIAAANILNGPLHSKRPSFFKYHEMQNLLMVIVGSSMTTELGESNQRNAGAQSVWSRAKEILDGMVRPRGPAQRAADRVQELENLALAYRIASGVFPVESPHLPEASTLLTEALKAWERAHPPAAIDPLLLP